jgi:putative heme-binding domain-containing protein
VIGLLGAGVQTLAQSSSQEHPGQYTTADIVNGSTLYREQCITCHGAFGNSVGTVDLRRGQFRSASSDEDLKKVISSGVPNTPMPAFKFNPTELNGIVAYIRSGLDVNAGAAKVGDPKRGQALFTGKGQCTTCHKVNASGGATGFAPDLGDVGAQRTALMLQMSISEPSSAMMPINRPVRITTKDGKTVRGRRLNEDTYSVQIINEQGRLQSVLKSDLKQLEVLTASPMPPYKDKLTTEETADLVAYLLTLRG